MPPRLNRHDLDAFDGLVARVEKSVSIVVEKNMRRKPSRSGQGLPPENRRSCARVRRQTRPCADCGNDASIGIHLDARRKGEVLVPPVQAPVELTKAAFEESFGLDLG